MLLKLEKPILLSKPVELLSELVTEVKFNVDSEGMKVVAIDPANVAMVSFYLKKDSFSQFELEKNESLGINLDDLKKILKRCGSKSSLILEKKENTLLIEIQDKMKRNFRLNLIEINKRDKEVSNLDFEASVEINSNDFIDAVEDCAVVADSCAFISKEDSFIIEAKNLNSARIEFSGDEAKINAKECKSKYSLEYLQKFIKGSKLCEKTKLNFSKDYPLRMDLDLNGAEISFILAPTVEED